MVGSFEGPVRVGAILLAATALAAVVLAGAPPERAAATTDCSLTAPANQTKPNDLNQAGAVVSYPAPTTTGTCSTVTCSPASGSFFPVGTTMATCTSSTTPPTKASFLVRVNDTQAPTVTVPANITVGNDPDRSWAVVSYPAATATDNVAGVTVSCDRPTNTAFTLGVTTVFCTARDAAGNTKSGSFTVTVNDTQAPVIEATPDVTALIRPSTDHAQVFYAFPGAHDNSGLPPTMSCAPQSGTEFALGATTVTCTATDIFGGNTATKTFQVNVFRDRYWCSLATAHLKKAKLKLAKLKQSGASPAQIRKAKQRVREGKLGVAKACADLPPVTSRR